MNTVTNDSSMVLASRAAIVVAIDGSRPELDEIFFPQRGCAMATASQIPLVTVE